MNLGSKRGGSIIIHLVMIVCGLGAMGYILHRAGISPTDVTTFVQNAITSIKAALDNFANMIRSSVHHP